ncbi:MAG TPA: C39 family peptidase [Candidatus Eisenbacteria bacterium]|nr:C39 family peptidase [Candidatus Eisenbacteria bacterium]
MALLATGAAAVVQDRPVLSINIPTLQLTNYTVVNEVGGVRTVDIPWIAQYAAGVYSYAVSIAAILAGVMFVVGGFQFLTAGGDASRVSKAKERIKDAIVGLFLTFGAYAILITINPNLVSLQHLRMETVKRVPFVRNETPPGEIDRGSGGSAPPGPAGPLTPVSIRHFAQCGSVGAATPYLARDGRCATQPNGTRYTLCTSGCGVASATMVIGSLTGRPLDQLGPELARLSSENGCRPCNSDCSDCSGTSENCLISPSVIGRYGLRGQAISGRERILQELRDGHPVVALYQRSVFTGGGHYIVLAGVNPDGTIRVLDPGKNASPYNYNCDQVHRSSPSASCPVSSDHMPPELIFGTGMSGTWLIRPQ